MSTNLRLIDGRTVAVREDVGEVLRLMEGNPNLPYATTGWHSFKMADNTNEARHIRLSAIIEICKGHSK